MSNTNPDPDRVPCQAIGWLERSSGAILAIVLAAMLSACATSGEPPADTSFAVSDVVITAAPGVDSKSAAPLDAASLELIKASILEEASRNAKTGPAKRLEVKVTSFDIASYGQAFVSGKDNRIYADVAVRDVATGSVEGEYFAHTETSLRRCCGQGAPAQPLEAAAATSKRMGKEIWEGAYKAGRKPAVSQ